MGVADRSEAREEASGALAERSRLAAPATNGLAAVALRLQRSAGNRGATAWAELIQRKPTKTKPKPKPKDPIDTAIGKKDWAKAADALSELPAAEIKAQIKKLKPKQRELVMQRAREIERTAWTEPVIVAMEKIDPKSANIGSLRWARASGFTARTGMWFHALASVGESCYEGILLLSSLARRAGSLDVARMTATAESLSYGGSRGAVRMHERHLDQRIYLAAADELGFDVVSRI